MYSHKFNNKRLIFKPVNGMLYCVNHSFRTLAEYLDLLSISLDPNCTKASFSFHDDDGELLYTIDFDSWVTTCLVTLTINIYTRNKKKIPHWVSIFPSNQKT